MTQNAQPIDQNENFRRNAEVAKSYIRVMSNRVLDGYRNTQDERYQIRRWEESRDFTILGVIETVTDDIRGYALQIITNQNIETPQSTIENLRQLQIFNIPYFAEWYFSSKEQHPQMQLYIQSLDYLRLLIIEYVSLYQAS